MNQKIASTANYLVALIFLALGIIYLFKPGFMPYHSEAISMTWDELDSPFQFLILALMRGAAGGAISLSVFIFILQLKFSKQKLSWIPLLLLTGGIIYSLCSLYATIIVSYNTPGNPPMTLLLVVILLLVIGYLFNRSVISKS